MEATFVVAEAFMASGLNLDALMAIKYLRNAARFPLPKSVFRRRSRYVILLPGNYCAENLSLGRDCEVAQLLCPG